MPMPLVVETSERKLLIRINILTSRPEAVLRELIPKITDRSSP